MWIIYQNHLPMSKFQCIQNSVVFKIFKISLIFIVLTACTEDDSSCDGGAFKGNVFLNSQEEVDVFGANCYSKIEGNLIIGLPSQPTDIHNLQPLSGLKEVVNGRLAIYADKLIDLKGLDNVTRLDGLRIDGCTSLITLFGLNSLSQIGITDVSDNSNQFDPSFIINYCPSLNSIEALDSLKKIQNFIIGGTVKLESLKGLENLDLVTGNLSIGYPSPHGEGANVNLVDYCALRHLFVNGEYNSDFVTIHSINFSPSIEDIMEGNCKK